jgi:isoprenylcysteine carboxyl methyltransferase (ICMT) family protein YpbQ
MRSARRRPVLAKLFLVLSLLLLARVAGSLGDAVASAALLIVFLMSVQAVAYADPNHSRGAVPRGRLRLMLLLRAVGFAGLAPFIVGSYVLQRIVLANDWSLHANALWLLLPLAFSVLLDSFSSRPYGDEFWTLGKLITAGRRGVTAIAKRDFGSCFIKVFFYPLMFVFLVQFIGRFDRLDLPNSWSPIQIYDIVGITYILVDVAFGASGYALSLRRIDNRVRSLNPYPAAWFVTLICYPPFWEILERLLFFQWYDNWLTWTKNWPAAQLVWLAAIVCCFVIYAWSTVEMGPKFSNLCYRGTVSSGPYRLMKHPAYVTKIVSYSLISAPFMQGWVFALQQYFMLASLSAIYYLRAKYEEKHLLRYADYRAYASSSISSRPGKYVLVA